MTEIQNLEVKNGPKRTVNLHHLRSNSDNHNSSPIKVPIRYYLTN